MLKRNGMKRPWAFMAAVMLVLLFAGMDTASANETETSTGIASRIGIDLRLGLGFGGDELAQVSYSDGSDWELRAGTYGTLGLGGVYTPWFRDSHALDLELFFGWASWSTGPENTDDRLSLHRFPIELLAFYRNNIPGIRDFSMRVGGGLAYHLVTGISGSGTLEGFEEDFDNSFGAVSELSFIYGILALSVRYTWMRYSTELIEDIDGSSFGFALSILGPLANTNPATS